MSELSQELVGEAVSKVGVVGEEVRKGKVFSSKTTFHETNSLLLDVSKQR